MNNVSERDHKKMTKRAGKKKSPVKSTNSRKAGSLVPKATGVAKEPDSFFWPELTEARKSEALSAGRGDAFKRFEDARLEIRAINERWPIPPALRERMIFENARIVIDAKAEPKQKLLASRILLAMDQANHKPKDLPEQIIGNQHITVTQVLQLIETGGEVSDDDLDLRDFKAIPGSADDYA